MKRPRVRGLAAAISAMGLVNLVFSLTPPLLAINLNRQGTDPSLIGLNIVAMTLGVFAIAPLAPKAMIQVSPARVMGWALAATAALFPLFPAFPSIYAWIPLSFLLGAAGSFCWISSEAWINSLVDDGRRGRVISVYTMAGYAGSMVGPLLLVAAGTSGWFPFLMAAAVIAAGYLLVASGGKTRPVMHGRPSARLWRFFLLAPVAMPLVFVEAGVGQALATFLPVYALERGVPETTALVFLTVMHAGGLVMQYPVGWLADRMNRTSLAGCGLAVLAVCLALVPEVVATGPLNFAVFFLVGGIRAGISTIAIVLVGQSFRGADLAAASTVFTVMWNVGALTGPGAAGVAMDVMGSAGLVVVLTGIVALLAFFVFAVGSRHR